MTEYGSAMIDVIWVCLYQSHTPFTARTSMTGTTKSTFPSAQIKTSCTHLISTTSQSHIIRGKFETLKAFQQFRFVFFCIHKFDVVLENITKQQIAAYLVLGELSLFAFSLWQEAAVLCTKQSKTDIKFGIFGKNFYNYAR